jgi:hypothetical protein
MRTSNYNIITLNGILLIFVFTLVYKNLINLFFNNLGHTISSFFLFLFIIFVIVKIKNKILLISKIQLILFSLLIYLILDSLYSYLFLYHIIDTRNILISFQQFFVPILIILFLFYIPINLILLRKVIYFSLPLYIFAVFELLLPTSIIEQIYHLTSNQGSFYLSAYFFWEFGQPIRRLGSLFFEPLTFGVFTAYMVITSYILNKSKFQKFFYINLGLISLVKSFYVITLFSMLINKKWKLYTSIVLIGIIFLSLFLIILEMEQNQIKILFLTLGNHLNGLISGLFNASEHLFFGHGLGTAGYKNELYNLSTSHSKVTEINIFFNDPYHGVGNESGLGIMVYQLGYGFTIIYSILHIKIINNLIKYNSYILVGLFIGLFIFFMLSESYYTLILYIYPFILYRVIEVKYYEEKQNVKKNFNY